MNETMDDIYEDIAEMLVAAFVGGLVVHLAWRARWRKRIRVDRQQWKTRMFAMQYGADRDTLRRLDPPITTSEQRRRAHVRKEDS